MKDKQGILLAVKVSLAANVLLFTIKGITLVIVNSLAVLADLGISVVALAVSVLLYYALNLADKPADLFHNYGYGKVEHVCEAIEGVVLIGLALAMSLQAGLHLIHPGEIKAPLVGFVASLLGVGINFWGARFILGEGERHDSPALRAEALHFRLEGFISLAISLAFALVMLFYFLGLLTPARYIDPIATLIVSAAIVFPSAGLLKEAFLKLLDASIGESGQMDVIRALTRHYHRYCNFKELRTRTAGRKRFVDLRLVVPEHVTVREAHRIAASIREEIAATIDESVVTVHLEPCAGDCLHLRDGGKCPYATETAVQ
jgi:cation diffusion facilitator family transporter